MFNYKKGIVFFSIITTLFTLIYIYVFLSPPKAMIMIQNISIESVKANLDDPFERNSLLNSYGANTKEIEEKEADIKIVKVECKIKNIGFKKITLPYIRFSQGQKMPPEILGNRIERLDRVGVTPISFMEEIQLSFGILASVTDDSYTQIIQTLENLDVYVIDYNKPFTDYEKCSAISKPIKLKEAR